MIDKSKLFDYLKGIYGDNAKFREGQLEAIISVLEGKRTLVVERTGWGKSLVYFLSTKILRDNGKGLTIVISPLLSLMNNQIDMAKRCKLNARTINSNNEEEWKKIKYEIAKDEVDILYIAPERLSNSEFMESVLLSISNSIGLLVIDEAHCISDWGHDFRPDYKRIKKLFDKIPQNSPVIATTATANDRVVEDIKEQLGENIYVQRGSLARDSIDIQVIHLDTREERMVWISDNIVKMEGTGIVYCLTINDCKLLNSWLQSKGIKSLAYYGRMDKKEKDDVENKFMKNEVKVVVATIALGMGIDKSDISFVIHFQKPANVVSYYQQIGRAGRGIAKSRAILLAGKEDDSINSYFINSAFPTHNEMNDVVEILSEADGMTKNQIETRINYSRTRLDKCLKYLLVMGDIYKEGSNYYKSVKEWKPDLEIADKIGGMRKKELKRMNDFINSDSCYMEFISKELNDTNFKKCGRCSNCSDNKISEFVSPKEVAKAVHFIKSKHLNIEPRKKWPNCLRDKNCDKLPKLNIFEEGIALSNYGDSGWGRVVARQNYKDGFFGDDLLKASSDLLKKWIVGKDITCLVYVPSIRRPNLVSNFAKKLAGELGLDFIVAIEKVENRVEQKTLNNSFKQFENALYGFDVVEVRNENVLLVDDMVDSRWTFTVCAHKLIEAGWGKVYPYALSNSAGTEVNNV